MVVHAGAYVIRVQWLACRAISESAELFVSHLAASAGLSAIARSYLCLMKVLLATVFVHR